MNSTRLLTAIATVLIAPDFVQEPPTTPQMRSPPEMVFSPWVKFCLKGQDGHQVCFAPNSHSKAGPRTFDGAPTDPDVFKAQQLKLQAELQRRADEARK